MAQKKLPSMQFYPGDWLKDPSLRAVSSAARGLWMDMLCLMWEANPRGFLQTPDGLPLGPAEIARMTGNSAREVTRMLGELERFGVFSRTDRGVIWSRRMVRDEQRRQQAAENGRKGGNPTLLRNRGLTQGLTQGLTKGVNQNANQNLTPSSSSSTSISTSVRSPPINPPQNSPSDLRPDGRSSPGGDVVSAGTNPDMCAFDQWWQYYPRKVGKQAAKWAYLAARKRICKETGCKPAEASQRLLEAVRAFAGSPKARGQYCPHPAKWLNEGRYDDDPAEWETTNNGDLPDRYMHDPNRPVEPL